MAYPQDLYTLTMAPRIAGDKVIIGASGGDKPTRGFFAAFDAKTGHSAWKFYTVPGNPELPPENDAMKAALKTWGGDFWTKGGGGAVWDGIAYDPEANLVYVGTGNAEPWHQKFRGAQNVDNLYTCSILAVDLTIRAAQVALPDHAQRQLGLRQRAAVDAARPEHPRQTA